MNATNFLIDFIFDTYLLIIIMRIWLQMARADFYNPFSQFIVKATNPVLIPLRRIIPGFGGLDLASILLAIVIAGLKFVALILVNKGQLDFTYLPLIAALLVVKKAGVALFWVMIIRAILSWVSQGRQPIEYIMAQLTEPLLTPIRRFIPAMGGLDLSMIVAFVALNFLNILMGDLFGQLWRSL